MSILHFCFPLVDRNLIHSDENGSFKSISEETYYYYGYFGRKSRVVIPAKRKMPSVKHSYAAQSRPHASRYPDDSVDNFHCDYAENGGENIYFSNQRYDIDAIYILRLNI